MTKTKRLYHDDPELRIFQAEVVETRPGPGETLEVVLDRTAFYPTGGGQPHDLGILDGRRVLDVFEEGERVVHRIKGEAPAGAVRGEVDWERRLDHRQQHTGQHILSRAFVDTADANTVGFHLGAERCTIDLDREDLDDEALERAERAANDMVLADVAVEAAVYPDLDAVPVHLRKEAAVTGDIRVVTVGDFDANACCGTHCARSGEVGPIKVVRTERKKGGLRVEFLCGRRALEDYRLRHRALRGLALDLTTEEPEVPARVAALREELKEARARAEWAEAELRERLVDDWAAETGSGPYARDLGPDRGSWLGPMASELAVRRGEPVLLVSAGPDGVQVALAVPETAEGNAGRILRALLEPRGGKGGGSNRLAQGRVPAAEGEALLRAWRESGAGGTEAQRGSDG
jgi:alanyl-tRNA synthetase